MKQNLQYQIHKLLCSPYKIYLNLFLLSILYLITYNTKITYCMIADTETTVLTEATAQVGQHISDLQKNIQNDVGSQTQLMEELAKQSKIITIKNEIIEDQHQLITQLQTNNDLVKRNLAETNIRLLTAEKHINNLERNINYGGTQANPEGYLNTITHLKAQLKNSQAQLQFSETLLANGRETKDCLYKIIEKKLNRTGE